VEINSKDVGIKSGKNIVTRNTERSIGSLVDSHSSRSIVYLANIPITSTSIRFEITNIVAAMSKKLLVVFGATGNQGGSIAETVLDDPELSNQYSVRAITRLSSNPKAQALQAKGAEIVEADLENPSTLKAALTGAHTVCA
jgi:putative NADH-flavin reductase